jgi:alkylhydroperoxidase family enzyme
MIGVIVSDVAGSEYAKQVHLHSLSVQGVQALWLRQLTVDSTDASALPDTLRALVRFARKAAIDPRQITADDFETLTDEGLSEAECFEVIATIDLFKSVNTYTDLARVEIDSL